MKILLNLSKKPFKSTGEKTYFYGEGETDYVKGDFTNDAPMAYFFKKYGGEITEVIVVCSEAVLEDGSFLRLRDEIIPNGVKVTKIESQGKENDKLSVEVMEALTPKKETEAQDQEKILIDSTGGQRNDILSMLITSELLSYHQVTIEEVVYADFSSTPHRLEPLKATTDLFQLISGMEEFTNTGSAISLEKYFALPTSKTTPSIRGVLSAIASLNDSIALCRSESIEEKLNTFNQALNQVKEEENPLFFMLIKTIQEKYGEEMNIIDLISWCLDNGKTQQALTLFTEKVPGYYYARFIDCGQSDWKPKKKEVYEDLEKLRFNEEFLVFDGTPEKVLRTFFESKVFQQNIIDYLNNKNNNNEIKNYFSNEYEMVGENLCYVIKTCYPAKLYTKKTPLASKVSCKLKYGTITPEPKELGAFLNNVSVASPKDLAALLNVPFDKDKSSGTNSHLKLLENLPLQLERKKYTINCTEAQLKEVVQDYLYIKTLRNQTNHANEIPIGDDKVLDYLNRANKDRYPPLAAISTTKEVEEIMRKMIASLKEM